ncbi:MAG: 4-(cytidine 5'-diphospho)-2-C-methyl-D-erythritol kinase [Akkermansiaceae bacterium]|jgi:4-diphosphocytidyl-2-C-methyl-D-erythritol kinase|nr:4-(cytidine 5'-diphospho)-2-C-methyl-D-erythritol kinase [Akkermansiaceae bacterium]
MTPLTLTAPAKLNLSLRVLGQRDDGFHDIDTLMVKLPGLADTLEFTPAEDFAFTCDDAGLPGGDDNLVVKAARAFAAAAGVKPRCRIHLAKRIPAAAGLGGGSSDAATTLLGLNRLHDEALPPARLREVAAALGSDVPFFLGEGAARCTGRGEVVTPVAEPPALDLLLLKPEFGVDTASAYARCLSARPLPGISYDPQELDGLTLVNDLERAVFRKFLILAEIKQWLLSRAEVAAALLCGSGSTVFAVLKDAASAPTLITASRQELDPKLWVWSGSSK